MAFAPMPFWNRVTKTDGCWLWTGPVESSGYGWSNARLAHRRSWEEANGPIPEGMCVLHTCDVRRCVRPTHLFLGTRAENNRDRAAKGRSAKGERHGTHTHVEAYRGERQSRARMTEGGVRELRRLRDTGATQVRLAQQFGISRRAVRAILVRETWGWLS